MLFVKRLMLLSVDIVILGALSGQGKMRFRNSRVTVPWYQCTSAYADRQWSSLSIRVVRSITECYCKCLC